MILVLVVRSQASFSFVFRYSVLRYFCCFSFSFRFQFHTHSLEFVSLLLLHITIEYAAHNILLFACLQNYRRRPFFYKDKAITDKNTRKKIYQQLRIMYNIIYKIPPPKKTNEQNIKSKSIGHITIVKRKEKV